MATTYPKVLFLAPWFGPLPGWLDATLRSMQANTAFRWLIPSDQPAPAALRHVENVTWLPMQLDDFIGLVEAQIGPVDRGAWEAKKIADFRPAFAEIFAEFIDGYDFWGHTDHDMFFGDLARFLPATVFDGRDIIGTHKNRISGPMCIYRNSPAVNRLWREEPELRELMRNVATQHFVEESAFSRVVTQRRADGRLRWLPRVALSGYPEDGLRYRFLDNRITVDGIDRVRSLARLRPPERLFYHFRTWSPGIAFDPFAVRGWVIQKEHCTPIA